MQGEGGEGIVAAGEGGEGREAGHIQADLKVGLVKHDTPRFGWVLLNGCIGTTMWRNQSEAEEDLAPLISHSQNSQCLLHHFPAILAVFSDHCTHYCFFLFPHIASTLPLSFF
ncbi:hypothetical protein E2C01_017899 [Portunus trituberculatus]|uniref:Uncharacterized protein n=1 Tax=Portunus trituberculatus TaxID=210409 RepID=A0A5B7DU30_PORTR|nr:hypothetical protein [Portunus trituberculatus]